MRLTHTHLHRGWLLILALLIVTIGGGVAQVSKTDALYGGNPYQVEEGDEDKSDMPPVIGKDSTKKKSGFKKPLESYFFSDSLRALNNISWNVSRDYNELKFSPIDTAITDWRIDYPLYKKGVGDMSLGGLGQAAQAIEYTQRAQDFNFSFARPYAGYVYTMENAPFYNLKHIYSQLTYIESGSRLYRETNFEVRHAQNISPTTGFNINYKSPGTRGVYMRQDTKNHDLSVAVSHTGKRYSIHAGYINNTIKVEENGGVVGEWAVVDSVFDMNIGIPMKLENAEAYNVYRNHSAYVVQSYGVPLVPMGERDFSMAELPSVYFGHSFEFNQWTKKYSDVYSKYTNDLSHRDDKGEMVSADYDYYDNWYINPWQTRDTLSERVISNRAFVQAQPWGRDKIVGTLNGGVGLDLHTYSQFKAGDYLTGELAKEHKTSWFVYGKVDGKLREYIDWGANFKLYPSGYRGGDMEAGANIALGANIANRMWYLKGEVNMVRQSPSYWEQNLYSNHYMWSNNFSTQGETRFKLSLMVPKNNFELTLTQSVATDKIYYNADAIVSQASSSVSVTSAYLRKNFQFKGLNLDHRLLWQMTSDEKVVAVPTLSAYLSYFYEFWVVKNVLRLQMGFDARYTTEYYMPGYNPALSTFYNQRDWKSGDYPYMDVYASGKWKRMRVLIKYQHLNQGLFGNREYFEVAGHPLNPRAFKIGISWSFYD